MSEKKKMLAGEYYNASDKALSQERLQAKTLCHEFNGLSPDSHQRKEIILEQLLTLNGNCRIKPSFYCDYGYNIKLGKNFYANHNCTILDPAPVTIGDDVLFGPNVTITTASHPLNPECRKTGLESASPINIGHNVWLGANVTVLPGVNIGDNAVIGAGSVVTRDIPANCVAVGVPCKVIKTECNAAR